MRALLPFIAAVSIFALTNTVAQAQVVDRVETYTYTLTGMIKSDGTDIVQIKGIPTLSECEDTINTIKEKTIQHSFFEGICTRALFVVERIKIID